MTVALWIISGVVLWLLVGYIGTRWYYKSNLLEPPVILGLILGPLTMLFYWFDLFDDSGFDHEAAAKKFLRIKD